MAMTLALSIFCVIGFAVWVGINRLAGLYEDRMPSGIQDRIYKVTKNFPKLAIDIVFSLIFWSGIGAVLVQFLLGLVGLDHYLPDSAWASQVVIFVLCMLLINYWSTPHRSEAKPPRGRDLRNNLQSSSTKRGNKSSPEKRGRTIRSYQDIR